MLDATCDSCQSRGAGHKEEQSDAADGVQYLRDMCLTLCCFLQAYPSGAQLLLQTQAAMVTHLTSLHDDLIPQIAKCVTAAAQHQQSQAPQVTPTAYVHACLFFANTTAATRGLDSATTSNLCQMMCCIKVWDTAVLMLCPVAARTDCSGETSLALHRPG